jgi:outer membrane protein assembly factor BamB
MKLRWVVAGLVGLPILVVLITLWTNRPPVPIVWRNVVHGTLGRELALGQDGTIYQKGFDSLRAYDRAGRLRWASPEDIRVDSAPVIGRDGTIYVREGTTRLTNGTLTTNTGLLALRADGSLKWRFPVKGMQATPHDTALALDERNTVYFTVGKDFDSPKTLFAVGADGQELWHFDSAAFHIAPIEIADDGLVLLMCTSGSPGRTKGWLDRFNAAGQSLGSQPQSAFDYPSSFSCDWDGIIYFPGTGGITMVAVNPNGSERWRFRSPFRAFSAPTIGTDGSLFFTAGCPGTHQAFLVALSKDGKQKWQLPLGPHWSMDSPAVASDGTLFVVSSDPKVTAVNKDGTLRWVFRPPRRFPWRWRLPWGRTPANWKDFKKVLSQNFGDGMNVFATPPALTPDGMLYLGFDDPYNTLYALNVGVGLATNSPWPTPGGDVRLTRRVAHRPPAGTVERTP